MKGKVQNMYNNHYQGFEYHMASRLSTIDLSSISLEAPMPSLIVV